MVLTLPDGRQVCVTVLAVQAGRVKVGIEAPADVRVSRGELLGKGEGT